MASCVTYPAHCFEFDLRNVRCLLDPNTPDALTHSVTVTKCPLQGCLLKREQDSETIDVGCVDGIAACESYDSRNSGRT
jgi:hypothetical protein